MPFILIKNYLKLMLRNKWILLIMTILPVIVVALLSSAFRDMLDTVHQVEKFRVGYRISENNIGNDLLPQLKTVCEENGVLLQEYPKEDINLLM
jgi:ABC-2 type transport system permease protein